MDDLPLISLRILYIDFYQTFPLQIHAQSTPFTTHQSLFKVPVIRIFGSTPQGHSCCLHVHQIYPYFYIPYHGSPHDFNTLQNDIYQLGRSINRALAMVLDKPKDELDSHEFVASIILVKGIPFYGFHAGYQYFLKIYLLNPYLIGKLVSILENGGILGRPFQTFHSHLSFPLQFMIDFNLYGMDLLDLSNVRVRVPRGELKTVSRYQESRQTRLPPNMEYHHTVYGPRRQI